MDIRSKIEHDLKTALKEGKEDVKSTLRLLLASVKYADKEVGKPIDDSAFIATIQKEIKMRKETIDGAIAAGRHDLVSRADNEVKILTSYLPRQLDDAELTAIVKKAIQTVGATSVADTGKIMKAVMPEVKGLASGDSVSKIVKELLS
ncbi:MAG TPA: GatB/YqeY domain-containing protein [Bellilinea sp.]|nr:GatB/YqeY domain-containing protein [Bellilinea sp.]